MAAQNEQRWKQRDECGLLALQGSDLVLALRMRR